MKRKQKEVKRQPPCKVGDIILSDYNGEWAKYEIIEVVAAERYGSGYFATGKGVKCSECGRTPIDIYQVDAAWFSPILNHVRPVSTEKRSDDCNFHYVIAGDHNVAVAFKSNLMLLEFIGHVAKRTKKLHPKGQDTVFKYGMIEFINPVIHMADDWKDRLPYLIYERTN